MKEYQGRVVGVQLSVHHHPLFDSMLHSDRILAVLAGETGLGDTLRPKNAYDTGIFGGRTCRDPIHPIFGFF
jgi:hypothetical protein